MKGEFIIYLIIFAQWEKHAEQKRFQSRFFEINISKRISIIHMYRYQWPSPEIVLKIFLRSSRKCSEFEVYYQLGGWLKRDLNGCFESFKRLGVTLSMTNELWTVISPCSECIFMTIFNSDIFVHQTGVCISADYIYALYE